LSRREQGLDLTWVRSQFPGLAAGWAFFDNAGGTLPAQQVIARVDEYMRRWPVQLGASYAVSAEAGRALERAGRAMAQLCDGGRGEGVGSEQVVLGPSTSSLFSRLARAMAPRLRAGDEVIVTDLDHEANITPWRRLAAQGVEVREWRVNADSLQLELSDLDTLLCERTRLVCFTHASNVLGVAQPVEAITRRAHACGARVCVDGVAYAPHRLLELAAWDVDFYAFSLYKVYGPHAAVLYGKRDALLGLANINHGFFSDDDLPWKLMPGAFPYELGYGALGICEYLEALAATVGAGNGDQPPLAVAFDCIARHEAMLCEPLQEFLASRPGVRVYGSRGEEPHAPLPTLAFTVDGIHASEIPPQVDPYKIGIRWGDFYAPRLIRRLGLSERGGVVRVSLAHYNSPDEVQRLIGVLERILP
jgi:cysteine desulfurase family protein (TIGR01976 family)